MRLKRFAIFVTLIVLLTGCEEDALTNFDLGDDTGVPDPGADPAEPVESGETPSEPPAPVPLFTEAEKNCVKTTTERELDRVLFYPYDRDFFGIRLGPTIEQMDRCEYEIDCYDFFGNSFSSGLIPFVKRLFEQALRECT